MFKSNKQESYNDEIKATNSKKEELLKLLKNYSVEVHTRVDTGYDYLEENDIVLIVKNPYSDNDMDIEMAGEFTVYFAEWHAHYFSYENEYRTMLKDIQNIIDCKACILKVSSTKRWLGSTIINENVIKTSDKMSLILKVVNQSEFLNEIKDIGGKLQLNYWNPELNLEIDL